MNIYKHYQTNDTAHLGTWTKWGSDGAAFKIARASGHDNPKFKNAMERTLRRYKNEIRLEVLPEEVSAEATYEVFADTIVLDWRGIQDENGGDLPYTRENVIRLFREIPELFDEIKTFAVDRQQFQDALMETDAKN